MAAKKTNAKPAKTADAPKKHRIYGMPFASVYPLMQKIRYLDLLVDELARGKKMESILRR